MSILVADPIKTDARNHTLFPSVQSTVLRAVTYSGNPLPANPQLAGSRQKPRLPDPANRTRLRVNRIPGTRLSARYPCGFSPMLRAIDPRNPRNQYRLIRKGIQKTSMPGCTKIQATRFARKWWPTWSASKKGRTLPHSELSREVGSAHITVTVLCLDSSSYASFMHARIFDQATRFARKAHLVGICMLGYWMRCTEKCIRWITGSESLIFHKTIDQFWSTSNNSNALLYY